MGNLVVGLRADDTSDWVDFSRPYVGFLNFSVSTRPQAEDLLFLRMIDVSVRPPVDWVFLQSVPTSPTRTSCI